MKCIVDGDLVLSQPLEGPVSVHIAAFAAWGRQQGYALRSRHHQVLLAASFSRWLGEHALSVRRVCPEHLKQYLRSRARGVRADRADAVVLQQFLEFLRAQGVVVAQKIVPRRLSPVEQETLAFERYLREERALAETTVAGYVPFIRDFLADRFGTGRTTVSRLCAGDVVRFVQRRAPRLHQKRAKVLTTALRSYLHYAWYRGEISVDLSAAVPCVASWSMSSIPRAIPSEAVRHLLASIDRHTPVGRRDYAILLLLARLGLRANEVAVLGLDDIDWAAAELSVRGKGGRQTTLPLSAEVGSAIAAYLRHGRPQSSSRRVFLRAKAPIRGFIGSDAISSLVGHALDRAGIKSPTKGAHQFRHALATQMLHHGASLAEIGEVLGHRSPQTTSIYAKVDLDALRPLALAWPGGAR